jgi:iron complex outermembrane receptor protein
MIGTTYGTLRLASPCLLGVGCVLLGLGPVPALAARPLVAAPAGAEVTRLPDLVVQGDKPAADNALAAPSQAAQTEAQPAPGASGLRQSSAILATVPGVMARGDSGIKDAIAIRGYGIAQPAVSTGVRTFLNGAPGSTADGFNIVDGFDPLPIRSVRVSKGNADPALGATVLGGSVDYLTPTGRDTPGVAARAEYGSFDHQRYNLQIGGARAADGANGLLSLTDAHEGGFRPFSAENKRGLFFTGGYALVADNPLSETRLDINVNDQSRRNAGPLTRAQIRQSPTQTNPLWVATGAGRSVSFLSFAPSQRIHLAEGNDLQIGGLFRQTHFLYTLPASITDDDIEDTAFYAHQELATEAWGLRHKLRWGAQTQNGTLNYNIYLNTGRAGVAQKGLAALLQGTHSGTQTAFFEDVVDLFPRFKLSTALTGIYATRDTQVHRTLAVAPSKGREFAGLSPRVGGLYTLTDGVEAFSSWSRGYEPPTARNVTDPLGAKQKAQWVDQIEGGMRFHRDGFSAQITAYSAWVHHLLLTGFPNQDAPAVITANAFQTSRNTGMEAALHQSVELDEKIKKTVGCDCRLDLNGAYTYTDFTVGGWQTAVQAGSRLPQIPVHAFNGSLIGRSNSGLFAGPTLQYIGPFFADYANTVASDPALLLGVRAGYETKQASFFIEARNVTNRHYATVNNVLFNAATGPATVFAPGAPAAIYGGVEIRL